MAANIQASSDAPLAAVIEAGGKISTNWAAFGDVWTQPFARTFGADVGARYKDSLDLYAGGSADLDGHAKGEIGMKFNF